MSQIIGFALNLNGAQYSFQQDPNPLYAKINQITIGESHQFGYDTKNSKDIGSLLQQCYYDHNIVAVIYNWKTGDAFLKNGFDLSNPGDYKVNQDYTSFVIKERVKPEFISKQVTNWQVSNNYSVGQQVNYNGSTYTCTHAHTSQQNNITLDSTLWSKGTTPNYPNNQTNWTEKYVGPNIFWLGYADIGLPSNTLIDGIFRDTVTLYGNCIRSHTLGFSDYLIDHIQSKEAWRPIDYSYQIAAKYNIKLIVCLTDQYNYFHGGLLKQCDKLGVNRNEVFTSSVIRSWFKNYITTYLNHINQYTGVAIKNNPNLLLLEISNELGEQRVVDGMNTNVPPVSFIQDIAQHIKTIAPNVLVNSGTDESLSITHDYTLNNIDVISSHFYSQDYSRMDGDAQNAVNNGKKYYVGEYDSNFGNDFFSHIENNPNIRGSFFWSLFPANKEITHDESYTIYLNDPNSQDRIQRIKGHFKRMRGIN